MREARFSRCCNAKGISSAVDFAAIKRWIVPQVWDPCRLAAKSVSEGNNVHTLKDIKTWR